MLNKKNLYEMARICFFHNNEYEIRIYPEKQKEPSFHLLKGNNWEAVIRMSDFTILEPKKPLSNDLKGKSISVLLNSKERKELRDKLLSSMKINNISCWKFIILTWNANNPDKEISYFKLPDFIGYYEKLINKFK